MVDFFAKAGFPSRSSVAKQKLKLSSKPTRSPALYCLSNDVSVWVAPANYQAKWQEQNENQPILCTLSMSELKEKRIRLGMIPTRASLQYVSTFSLRFQN